MSRTDTLSSFVLWKDPEATCAKGLAAQFDLLDTFGDESHWNRYLLKCKCCGHRYVYEFYEEIDWENGEDPQMSIWVPVETDDEIGTAKATVPGGLVRFSPRLCKDWPKGQARPSLRWVQDTD
jgi:hypothetical protein